VQEAYLAQGDAV